MQKPFDINVELSEVEALFQLEPAVDVVNSIHFLIIRLVAFSTHSHSRRIAAPDEAVSGGESRQKGVPGNCVAHRYCLFYEYVL